MKVKILNLALLGLKRYFFMCINFDWHNAHDFYSTCDIPILNPPGPRFYYLMLFGSIY